MSSEDFENLKLSSAAKEGDLSQVQVLVEQWRSELLPALLTPQHLNSALVEAVSYHRVAVTSYLLDQGAEISPNMIVLALGKTQDAIAMFQTYLDHGWDINSRTGLGVPALKHIIGDEELTRWFLEHGADPNAVGKPGTNILDVTAVNSTPAVFELLLKHGARLKDSDALHSAAGELQKKTGRIEMMQYLLAKGMKIDTLWRREYPPGRRMGRGTPLHAATSSQQRDRILLLLERGADPKAENTLGQTPFQYAMEKNLSESIQVLQKYA